MKRKIQYVWLMLAVCVLIFISTVENSKIVQAATFENGYYCETVQGTLKVDYTVRGEFGEYNQTTSPDDRCDNVPINVSKSLEIPVNVNVRRNVNSASYTMSVNTTSGWHAEQYCRGDWYEDWQGSYIICDGIAAFLSLIHI